MPKRRDHNPPPTTLGPLVDFARRHAQVALRTTTCQVCDNGYTLAPRTVANHNLIFVARGRAVWVVDDEPITLDTGEFVIVPPGVPHHAYSNTKRVTLLSLHIAATLPGGQDLFDMLAPPRHQRPRPRSYLAQYLHAAIAEFDRPGKEEARLMVGAWTRLIVLELLTDNAQRGLLDVQPPDPIVTEVMAELNRRISEPMRLEELAAWVGYSAQHLNRRFRQKLGVTPLQYLTQLRMQHAAGLLADGRLTVQAVAERVGCEDPYYFSRLFKQHLGQSPARYRDAISESARSNSPSPDSTGPFPRGGK